MKLLRFLPLAACVLALGGCDFLGGDETPDAGPSDAGCAIPCGASCCATGQECKSGTCQAPCTPNCSGKQCGSDGCNGSCGECGGSKVCNDSTGQCENCTPNCTNKECGSDGCGGTCAPNSCAAGTSCQSGKCMACQPQCAGKSCGPNGCGGTCGTCPAGACDTSAGQCVGCLQESDCAGNPNGAHCDTTKRQCVPCLQNTDCRQDGTITCDPSTHTCQVSCSSSTECASVIGAHQCNTVTGKCVPCLTNNDCTSGTAPTCDVTTNTCVYCITGQDCERISGGTKHLCKNRTSCAQCGTNTDCTTTGAGQACDTSTNTCVECTQNADCGAQFCSPTKQCVECLSSANCTSDPQAKVCSSQYQCVMCAGDGDCGQYSASLKRCLQGACYQCTQNTDCAGANAVCSASHTCGFAAPTNDTCSTPKALTFTNDVAADVGDLTNANPNYTTTCGGGGAGKDLVYSFTIPGTGSRKFGVEVSTTGSWLPYVQVRSGTCTGTTVGCAQSTGAGTPAQYMGVGTGGATYYVIVDSDSSATPGQFTIKVALGPTNENCATAKLLTVPSSNTLTFSGTTRLATQDTSVPAGVAYCSSSSGPDLVYYLVLTSSGSVSVSVANGTSTWSPVVYGSYGSSTAACTSGNPWASTGICKAGSAGGSVTATSSYLTASTTSPTYVYFAIDGASSSSGDFTVTVQAPGSGPTTETNCTNFLDDDGDGDTDCADIDCVTNPACTPTSETNCTNGIDDDGDGATDCKDSDCAGDPSCGTTTTEVCDNMQDDDGDGKVDCDDTVDCPAGATNWWCGYTPGDSCSSVIPTMPAFRYDSTNALYVTTVQGTTAGYTHNYTGSCTSSTAADVVYKVTVPSATAARTVAADVIPIGTTSWKPAVLVRTATCTSTTETACGPYDATYGDAYDSWSLAANTTGTYYIIVSGDSTTTTSSGKFYLQVLYK